MKPEIKYYQSRTARITGTNYRELHNKARAIFHDIEILTGNSHITPTVRVKNGVEFYRFYGITKDKFKFTVQIKHEDGALYHMSVFAPKRQD
ncbi:MAG: hypothetical protein LBL08_03850 [Candidatus Nomurabacteria bacterium]|jgi:hypothetical protein|nr:hypothetical protein [Candidatus Nomurabacteria bacterium]